MTCQRSRRSTAIALAIVVLACGAAHRVDDRSGDTPRDHRFEFTVTLPGISAHLASETSR